MTNFKRKTKEQKLKDEIEKSYLKEGKSPEKIAEEKGMPIEAVECLIKFFRLDKSKVLKAKTKEIKEDLAKKRTEKETLKEFRKLKRKLRRTPMLLELPKMGRSGLRRDILKYWGKYTNFLTENRLGKPMPKKGIRNAENFRRLASKAAIRYHQKGKWSKSEEKIARILREELGLIENLDWFHNFKLKTPNLNGSVYELDFYLPRFHLVLEADSFWHSIGESKAKDNLRDLWVKEYLNSETIRFNQFTPKALHKIKEVLRKLLKET